MALIYKYKDGNPFKPKALSSETTQMYTPLAVKIAPKSIEEAKARAVQAKKDEIKEQLIEDAYTKWFREHNKPSKSEQMRQVAKLGQFYSEKELNRRYENDAREQAVELRAEENRPINDDYIGEKAFDYATMILGPEEILAKGILRKALTTGVGKALEKKTGNKLASITQKELNRANKDAELFSQSIFNKKKLDEFRDNKNFSATNQKARFIDDPKALNLYEKYKFENDPNLSINQYLGNNRGIYGAKDYGDLNDVVLINKYAPHTPNVPSKQVYTDAMHETTHSRSIRLGATDAEKQIASDAWQPMIKKNDFNLPEEEAFAVQNELRTDKLKDIKGDRVYTEKDIPEIKQGLQKMINENHDYLKNTNIEDFNMSALIKSLNKIGLAATIPAVMSVQQKKKGGLIYKPY
jgi:hypothetical protein